MSYLFLIFLLLISILYLAYSKNFPFNNQAKSFTRTHQNSSHLSNPPKKKPDKFIQETPRIPVRPLESYRNPPINNCHIMETPQYKTKTLIINCDDKKENIPPQNKIWNLDFTPSLSCKYK